MRDVSRPSGKAFFPCVDVQMTTQRCVKSFERLGSRAAEQCVRFVGRVSLSASRDESSGYATPSESGATGSRGRDQKAPSYDQFPRISSSLCGKNAPKHSRDWARPVSTKTEEENAYRQS